MVLPLELEGPSALIAFNLTGEVTGADYREVLEPAVEKVVARGLRPRLLAHFDREFRCYSLAALMEDAKFNRRHRRDFERIAVVTDKPFVRRAFDELAQEIEGEIRVFELGEESEAHAWLSSSSVCD